MSNMDKTGVIWEQHPRARGQIVRRVCEAMESEYGLPRLGNPDEPLDDLIYIIISNKTSPEMAQRTYARIKAEFAAWDDALAASQSALQRLLQPAGLGTVKSHQIHAALRKINNDFGSCDLNRLREKPLDEVQEYLVSLPGISEKVAKCVMIFTLGLNVLPVDSHVHRIARRLGWTSRKRADQCHRELEALIPPKRRHAFHVDCIMHGRLVCRPSSPACNHCCINRHCEFFRSQVFND